MPAAELWSLNSTRIAHACEHRHEHALHACTNSHSHTDSKRFRKLTVGDVNTRLAVAGIEVGNTVDSSTLLYL